MALLLAFCLQKVIVTGRNDNSNLGVPETNEVAKFTTIDDKDNFVYYIATNKLGTMYYEGSSMKTTVMGTNAKGMLCLDTATYKVISEPRTEYLTFPETGDRVRIMDVTATDDSVLIITMDEKLYGCGSNARGQLTFDGTADENDHVLERLSQPLFNVSSIGSAFNRHFFTTYKKSGSQYTRDLYVYGTCPIEGMCTKDGANRTHFNLPIDSTDINEFGYFPETLIAIAYDGPTFVIGKDPCTGEYSNEWRKFPFSHFERINFGAEKTILSQNNTVLVCSGTKDAHGRPEVIYGQYDSEVSDVTSHGSAIMVSGKFGLEIEGPNPNHVLGACFNEVDGVCPRQMSADVTYSRANILTPVEGYSTVMQYGVFNHKWYYSGYDAEATADSVSVAGKFWDFLGAPKTGFAVMPRVPTFGSMRPSASGFLAVSDKNRLWSFGDNSKFQAAKQWGLEVRTPSVALVFQDDKIVSFDAWGQNGIAMNSLGRVFTFGDNTDKMLGPDAYASAQRAVEPATARQRLRIELIGDETVRQVAIWQQTYYILTTKRLLYLGICQGSCGLDANGNAVEGSTNGELKEFNLPIPAANITEIRTSQGGVVFVGTKTIFVIGKNEHGELCQAPGPVVSPKTLPLDGVTYISLGAEISAFVVNNSMYICGQNQYGEQFITGDQPQLYAPTALQIAGQVTEVHTFGGLVLAIVDGKVVARGHSADFARLGFSREFLAEWTTIELATAVNQIVSGFESIMTVNNPKYGPIVYEADPKPEEEEEVPEEEEETVPEEEETIPEEEEEEEQEPEEPKKKSNTLAVVLGVTLPVAAIAIGLGIWALYRKKRGGDYVKIQNVAV